MIYTVRRHFVRKMDDHHPLMIFGWIVENIAKTEIARHQDGFVPLSEFIDFFIVGPTEPMIADIFDLVSLFTKYATS